MSAEFTGLSATGLVAAYRRKEISPVEVTQAVLEGIEEFDTLVNAFCVASCRLRTKLSRKKLNAGTSATASSVPAAASSTSV